MNCPRVRWARREAVEAIPWGRVAADGTKHAQHASCAREHYSGRSSTCGGVCATSDWFVASRKVSFPTTIRIFTLKRTKVYYVVRGEGWTLYDGRYVRLARGHYFDIPERDSPHDHHTPRGAERLVTGTAMTRTSARSRSIGGRLRGIRAQPSQPSTRSTGCGSN
jgi:hypothetical protein